MPNVNDIEYAYGRVYRYIKPNSTDPGTWRVSAPEAGNGVPGGGGGGCLLYTSPSPRDRQKSRMPSSA